MEVAQLARLTLGEAEDLFATGRISQTEYEAYRRGWADAGGTARGYRSAVGWDRPSDDPAVESLAADLVAYAAAHSRPPRVWNRYAR